MFEPHGLGGVLCVAGIHVCICNSGIFYNKNFEMGLLIRCSERCFFYRLEKGGICLCYIRCLKAWRGCPGKERYRSRSCESTSPPTGGNSSMMPGFMLYSVVVSLRVVCYSLTWNPILRCVDVGFLWGGEVGVNMPFRIFEQHNNQDTLLLRQLRYSRTLLH